MELEKKPKTIPDAIRNYVEVKAPAGVKGYKLGRKNQAKLERIRAKAAQMRGGR